MAERICEVLVRHRDGSWLLVQRSYRKKTFPGDWDTGAGGRIEPGESPEHAARRELFEETGLCAQELLPLYHLYMEETEIFGFLHITGADKQAIVLQREECEAFRWVDGNVFEHFVRNELTGNKKYRLIKALFEEAAEDVGAVCQADRG